MTRPKARLLFLLTIAVLGAKALAGDRATVKATPAATQTIDRVIVFKHDHLLRLMSNGRVVKEYKVALGAAPDEPKRREGDHRTPEGVYHLDYRNAHSHYYKSIHISYPNATDRASAAKLGVNPGGDVMIHGLPDGQGSIGALHRVYDWTWGCIAVTNQEMDEIWGLVRDGTPIEIRR